MKLIFPILLIISFSVYGQGGPGHNGNRTHLIKVNNAIKKTTHSAGEYHIIVSQAMRHDSLMVVKWQKRLDSLHKYENPKYLAIDKKNWAWADSLNRWLIRKSEDEYLNEPKVSIDAARTKKDREARAKK